MIVIDNRSFDEERALYGIKDTIVNNCNFDGPADGESAFKECSNIEVNNCLMNLRYPFWHVDGASISDCNMTPNCRAALWYDNNIVVRKSKMHGIKAFRECTKVDIIECDVDSPEYLWRCDGVNIEKTTMNSEYPLFECKNVHINELTMTGKYSFQYVENMTITNSNLDTKDAFWHSENVTVIDSVVKGEYLGWYSKNLKFVRCTIIGTQPLCYCKNLILEDCTMVDTDLSFERSEVNATIKGSIMGVKNPIRGRIVADEIGELLIESAYVDGSQTEIECDTIKVVANFL